MDTIYSRWSILKDWVIFRLFERPGEIEKKKNWGGNVNLFVVLFIELISWEILVFDIIVSFRVIIDKILMLIHYLLMQKYIIRWYLKNRILIEGECASIVLFKEMVWSFSWFKWSVVQKHFCRNEQHLAAIWWFVDMTSFFMNVSHSF